MLHRSRSFALIALLALAASVAADEAKKARADFPGLKSRLVGPFVGGRATRVQGLAADPFTYYVSTASGGVWKSIDGGQKWSSDLGKTWLNPALPLAQLYHGGTDNAVPYHVHGAMQDLDTAWGPSNSLRSDGIVNGEWSDIGSGEAGQLYSRLGPLYSYVVANDGVPTQAMREVHAAQKAELDFLDRQWQALAATDLATVSQTAQPAIVIRRPAGTERLREP